MAAVSEKARQLGKDVTLPGTSASDAAIAMTELAKAGFSVEQSMTAAKGTLQLAAAAQIDAATAAQIQAKALNSFGLDATYAAKAADVFANAANASSAEITDVALALQQSGAVAKTFGISLEDTTAAIAVLANAGIRGSDAGTLLKTSLLALTDQGKPAQKAIKDLGLTLYDAQGRFVGLQAEFDQLGAAAKRMTPQQYQAATSILYGSDAARLAGVAANDGAVKFGAMRTALERQGAAAEVAAAKMQGLPGALQQIENSAQDAAIEIYSLIQGPLTALATKGAALIGTATDKISAGLKGLGSTSIDTDFGRGFVDALDRVGDVAGKAYTAIQPVVSGLISFGQESLRTGGTVETLGHGVELLVGTVSALVTVVTPALALLGSVVRIFGELPTGVQLAVGALVLLRLTSSTLVASITTLGARISTLGLNAGLAVFSFRTLSASLGTFGAVTNIAGRAASSFVAALGGPWAIGIAAASIALVSLYSSVKQSEENQKAYEASVRDSAIAQSALTDALVLSQGVFNSDVLSKTTDRVSKFREELENAGKNGADVWQQGLAVVSLGLNESAKNMDDQANSASNAKRALDGLNLTNEKLAEALADDTKFAALISQLQAAGGEGQEAARRLQALRTEITGAQESASHTSPAFGVLSDAVRKLADSSASAEDRTNALKTALDILAGKPVKVAEAVAAYDKSVREVSESTKAAFAATDGLGKALVNVDGSVNTATVNGGKLFDALKNIKDASVAVAAAGGDLTPVFAKNEGQFRALATATGLSVEQIRAMSAATGLVPRNLEILAGLKGADSVQQKLVVIQGLLQTNADGVKIPVNADTQGAIDKLKEIGVKVETVNGEPGIVKVTAVTDEAKRKLQEIQDITLETKSLDVQVKLKGAGADLVLGTGLGQIPAELLPGHAVGGKLPSSGPGTGTTDGILAVDAAGIPRARIDGGEWMINRGMSSLYNSELAMINAGTFPKLPGFASGGRLPIDQALSQLRGESGKAYQYGGTGNPSWDCSGFMSAAYALLKGLDWHTRWFTTESNFGSLGFASGVGPSNGFTIGVHNGGGGQMSHMAGLLNGVPIESGGNGVRVGSGAHGALDGQFENKYYLVGAGSGTGSSRTKPWSDKDELNLQSATVAVQQAKEAQARAAGNKNKSPADIQQANLRVQKAEQRVKDLESQKASGTSSEIVPNAPALNGAYSKDQLSQRDLQRAVDDANDKRDEVYADTKASDRDRAKADDDLRKAILALQEGGKDKSSSSSASNPVELIGDAVKTAVTGQLDDALGVFGLDSSLGATGALVTTIANRSAPSFGKDELDKQGPVTPGSPDWLAQLMKTLKMPAFLRDSGGPVPTGSAAINLSGATEWMLTNDGASAVARMAAAAKAGSTTNGGQSVDASWNIEHLHTGMSQREYENAVRIQRVEQRQRARSFIGR
jgi:TP901 family phage tail tape measure protein